MTEEHAAVRHAKGVQRLAGFWFDLSPAEDVAQAVASMAVSLGIGAKEMNAGCLGESADGCCGVLIWLKSRLRERGLCDALKIGYPGQYEQFVTAEHHYPALNLAPDAAAVWLGDLQKMAGILYRGTARSQLPLSPLATIEPIDRVAARLVKFRDDSPCPYCKRHFRNGAALRLHLVQSHGVTE